MPSSRSRKEAGVFEASQLVQGILLEDKIGKVGKNQTFPSGRNMTPGYYYP